MIITAAAVSAASAAYASEQQRLAIDPEYRARKQAEAEHRAAREALKAQNKARARGEWQQSSRRAATKDTN